MHFLLLSILPWLLLSGCTKPPYHYPGQYPGSPARIACSSCHKDVRKSFDHKRGWCDDHTRNKRHNDICSACHKDTACHRCHRDASGKLIWSDMRKNRWYRSKD